MPVEVAGAELEVALLLLPPGLDPLGAPLAEPVVDALPLFTPPEETVADTLFVGA